MCFMHFVCEISNIQHKLDPRTFSRTNPRLSLQLALSDIQPAPKLEEPTSKSSAMKPGSDVARGPIRALVEKRCRIGRGPLLRDPGARETCRALLCLVTQAFWFHTQTQGVLVSHANARTNLEGDVLFLDGAVLWTRCIERCNFGMGGIPARAASTM